MFLPLFAPFLILKITRKHTKFPHLGTDFPIKNRLFYGIRSHFEDTYGNFRHNLSSSAKLTVYKEKKLRRRLNDSDGNRRQAEVFLW